MKTGYVIDLSKQVFHVIYIALKFTNVATENFAMLGRISFTNRGSKIDAVIYHDT